MADKWTQIGLAEVDENYQAFVDKFKPKKTTDDCYTPENIYETVAEWTAQEYGVRREDFIRPFWPGADYRRTEYPPGCVVCDNPPFSILREIVDYYDAASIPFMLFGPALTIITGYRPGKRICYICTGANITFENGANVAISFVTNLEKGGVILRSAPDLYDALSEVNSKNLKQGKIELPKYTYPDEVIHAARVQYYSAHHQEYRLKAKDAMHINRLDEQRKHGKSIFGGGFLLSEKAAAEKAAAEKAAAEKAAAEEAAVFFWKLSEREREMQKCLG